VPFFSPYLGVDCFDFKKLSLTLSLKMVDVNLAIYGSVDKRRDIVVFRFFSGGGV